MANEFPDILSSYKQYVADHKVGQSQSGSRLIPRTVVDRNLTDLIGVFRRMVQAGADIGATCNNISMQGVPPQNNSVDPERRKAIFNFEFSL